LTKERFKSLFEQHFDTVRNYIYYRSGNEELATDIAQEAFMRIWEKKTVNSSDKVIGLIYKIASDIFVSKYRRQQVELKFQKTLNPNHTYYSPEDEFQFNELKIKYEKALSKLSEKQRIVYLLSRKDELKYSEIAKRLNLSIKAIEKRMSKAIAFIREEMKEFIATTN
jgi:RNA polymerase sigma-70 factor (ECF subfamily)